MKSKKVIAIVIGSLLGVGLIIGGFLFMQNFTRASSEKPEMVEVSEITSSSAKVSWTTGNDTVGAVVHYGLSPTSLTQFAPAETPQGKQHTASVTLLTPNTTYYFELFAGENTKFDNGGVPWSFTTKSANETTADLIASPSSPLTTGVAGSASPTPTGTSKLQQSTKGTCTDTDCAAIKAKLGTQCSTQEYIKCIKAQQNPSPAN